MSAAATTLRVAVAQMGGVLGDTGKNQVRALEMIDDAEAQGADLVVFPELALTGLTVEDFAYEAAVTLDSELLAPFKARSEEISIAIGFLELGGPGEIFNSVAYYERGELVHVHRKLYLTTYGDLSEGKVLTPGDRFDSFPTRFGPMAIVICEDAWHVPLPYLAAMSGAQILLTCVASPRGNTSASCPSEVLWRTVNRSTAVTLKLVTVFANRVGPEDPHSFWGGSHVINTDGQMLLDLEHDDEVVAIADIDLTDIGRQRYRFPYLRDERLDMTLRELQRVAHERWSTPRPQVNAYREEPNGQQHADRPRSNARSSETP